MFKVVRSATMLKLETNVDLKDEVHLASGNTKEQLATGKTEELANCKTEEELATGKFEEQLAAGKAEEFPAFYAGDNSIDKITKQLLT